MEANQPAEEKNSSYLRLRLSLSPSHLSYQRLLGKTEKESRAWAVMALEYVASLQDIASQTDDGRPNIEIPSPSRKRSYTKAAVTPQKTGKAKVAIVGREVPASIEDPGGGNYLAKEIEGW